MTVPRAALLSSRLSRSALLSELDAHSTSMGDGDKFVHRTLVDVLFVCCFSHDVLVVMFSLLWDWIVLTSCFGFLTACVSCLSPGRVACMTCLLCGICFKSHLFFKQ
jgi:hypothetical protein